MPKILIVDDEASIRDMLRFHLENTDKNYEISEATNGKEALEFADKTSFDVIVLDINMPVMDGLAACQALRANASQSVLYIIMLSARSETSDKIGGIKDGADVYLTKPFAPEEVLAYIEQGVKTAKERRIANTDSLTGLANRHVFSTNLANEVERAKRFKHPLSFILLDIDHFKAVNDTYGHQTGDTTLQVLANLLQDTVRTIDLPCRYGGEEFAIILPETNQAGAKQVAEQVRKTIEKHLFPEVEKITISLGVAEFFSEEQAIDFIRRTDQALYQAKKNGRNQSFLAPKKKEKIMPTILVIDDESSLREMIQFNLELLGFKVFIASGGKEGIETFSDKNTAIDAILLDQTMPGLDGMGTISGLLKINPHIAVIMLTALESVHLVTEFMKAGGADFVNKPVTDFPMLGSRIQKAVENSLLRRELEKERIVRKSVEKSAKLVKNFLTNASHEIRTPLSVILNFTQLAKKKMEAGDIEEAKVFLDRLLGNQDKLLSLLDNFEKEADKLLKEP